MVRFYHKPDLLSIYSHQLCLRAHAERGHEGDSCCVPTRSVGTRGTLLRAHAERGHEGEPSSRFLPSAPAIPFLSASYIDIMNQIT